MNFVDQLDRAGVVCLAGGFRSEPVLLAEPRRVIRCDRAGNLQDCLNDVEAASRSGYFCAGFLSYEAGEQLVGLPARKNVDFPRLWFGVYEELQELEDFPGRTADNFEVQLTPELPRNRYRSGFDRVREHLRQGETYQTNFSFRLTGRAPVGPAELFLTCFHHHPVPYGAFVNTGEFSLGSLSPEVFLKRRGEIIEARPMKGTASRGRFPQTDDEQRRWLENSEKNRAENLMIVDLLRNDLGRLAPPGAVEVPELFQVDTYRTVHQMTSTVRARSSAGFARVIRDTFPSGSVTGAPKYRTMEIIRQVEHSLRKIYTGGIGLLEPGGNFTFNVAIRTFLCRNADRCLELGVGGGLVNDSEPDSEWEEAKLKGTFLNYRRRDFSLIETMLCQPDEGIELLDLHLERLRRSARFFDINLEFERLREMIELRQAPAGEAFVLRLLVDRDGNCSFERRELPTTPASAVVRLAAERVDSQETFRRHKTTRRELYDRYRKKTESSEIFEYIFLNEAGQLVEGTVSNLLLELDGELTTPRLESGALPGVKRRELIKSGSVEARNLRLGDLRRADKVCLTNAVRGVVEVDSVRGLDAVQDESFS